MNDVVVLDTTPLGLLANPNHSRGPVACRRWVAALQAVGRQVILPEIADYEIHRELLRANLVASVRLLDDLARQLTYLRLTTAMLHRAAELWAQARNTGRQTAPDPALDCDVILAAQALSLGVPVVVATSNPTHLSRYVTTDLWQNIAP